MVAALRSGIVRILDADGSTAGTGFVVSADGLIATCSHVMQDVESQQRGGPRPERARIVFLGNGEERQALVKIDCWVPREQGDVAILRVEGSLPEEVSVLPLGSAAASAGHTFWTRGFRGESERAGGGEILGLIRLASGHDALQLRSQEVTQGYSGGPIWDEQAEQVIGMVSDIGRPDDHGRGRDTAFATPTETLQQACPALELAGATIHARPPNVATQKAERDARRDYEYKARKRLYTKLEPLFFQLDGSSGAVIRRVQRLAEASRQQYLTPGPGHWLGGEGYFMLSTMYDIVAPHVYVRLLQDALITLDLTVDPAVRHQYSLAQALHRSINADYNLASIEPKLSYDPFHKDAAERVIQEPAVYRQQGLDSGSRDRAVEALIKRDPSGSARCMSPNEFFAENESEEGSVRAAFRPVFELFRDFQPASHPVLWRILIAQVQICHELRQAQAAKLGLELSDTGEVPSLRTEIDPPLFDWRSQADTATDEAVLETPFDVGRRFIERLISTMRL